jgi:hypothetical protein
MSGTDGTPTPPVTQISDLPQWAQEYIANLRQEAADHRVKKNQLQQELTAANEKLAGLQTELAEVKKTAESASMESKKLQIALEAGIPGEKAVSYAPRLVGNTEDELREDAKKLAADLAPALGTVQQQPATDRSQGAGNAGVAFTNKNLSEGAREFANLVYGRLAGPSV